MFCLENYFEENVRLKSFLERIRDANKHIFLITNSAYWYVNRGMSFSIGNQLAEILRCRYMSSEKTFLSLVLKSGQ